MFLVGLTGGIASGKSTVKNIFEREFGCPCIDADLIARQVVEPGKSAYSKIKKSFGDEVFHEDGQLNRDRLGQMIFHDEARRKQLNAIVHPAVQHQMMWEIFLYFIRGYQFVIMDIPLLFETKRFLPYVSYTIVVFCNKEQQLNRLMTRNSLSKDDAVARIKSQLPLADKCKLSTYVIDNCGAIENTREQVKSIYLNLQASRKHIFPRVVILVLTIIVAVSVRFLF